MMTLCNCGITPNPILNLHRTTRLVINVTIGQTYSIHMTLNQTLQEKWSQENVENTKDLPATTFIFCPNGHKLGQ